MIKNILRKIKYKLKNTFSMKIPVNNPILYGELLKGRCALITGGTSGIGFAIAEAFLRNKADIIITGRNESKIEKAVNQLKKEFAEQKVIGIVLDNCDVTKMKDIFQNPLLGGLKIDILVNNAGVINKTFFGNTLESDFDMNYWQDEWMMMMKHSKYFPEFYFLSYIQQIIHLRNMGLLNPYQ